MVGGTGGAGRLVVMALQDLFSFLQNTHGDGYCDLDFGVYSSLILYEGWMVR
jgi:hypothetical protein